MLDRQIKLGATSNIIRVKLRKADTGQGLTGLSSATTGLIISTICDNEASATVYTVAASHVEAVSALGTYAAPTSLKCRFSEVDATNHPGTYEIHLADARFAVTSARVLRISILGAANLLERELVIELVGYDPTAADVGQSGDAYARIGAAGAGLTAIGDTRMGNLDVAVSSRLAPTTAARTLDVSATGEAGLDFDNIKVATAPTTLTNITVPTVTTTTTATNLTNAPTAGDFNATMKASMATEATIAAAILVTPSNKLVTNASGKAAATVAAGDIATDAITAAAVKADAVTKIQNGLATPTNITAGTITTVGTTTNLTNLPAAPTDWLTAGAVKADAVAKLWGGIIEGTIAARQAMQVFLAYCAGKSLATGRYRDQADTKDRISATASSGRRTAVTLNLD